MNFQDHYWGVEGNTLQVYSSKFGDFVYADDPEYLEWSKQPHNRTGTWGGTARELGTYLGENLAPAPKPLGMLDAYQDAQVDTLTPGGTIPKILYWIINEIRELKGQQKLTFAQFRAFVKIAMMVEPAPMSPPELPPDSPPDSPPNSP